MTPLENLLARVTGVKQTGKGWSARCPAHDDRKASLSIAEGDDGTVLLKCHAGCSTEAVLRAMGLELRDLFATTKAAERDSKPTNNGQHADAGRVFPTARDAVVELERRPGKRAATWTYHDAQGEPIGLVLRWDSAAGKDIRPVAKFPDGWRIAAMPTPRPLYRLPELLKAGPDAPIVVLEGEKCCDAAVSLGFVATTSSGGAQAAHKT
ncbi:MAG: hypothetical protein NZO58_13385, partial [Gemmataceae bacterium]|nr:hypothetical protein [Gemmataceae bacterium]